MNRRVLVLALLSAGLLMAITARIPQSIFSDPSWQFRGLQQYQAGESPSPNHFVTPKPGDLSQDDARWGFWWPPGSPILVNVLMTSGLSLGSALRCLTLLCLVLGVLGWIYWFSLFDIPRGIRIVLAFLWPWIRYASDPIFYYSTEIMVFGFVPWVLILTQHILCSWKRNDPPGMKRWMCLLSLALLAGFLYWMKYSLLFLKISILIIVLYSYYRAQRPEQWAEAFVLMALAVCPVVLLTVLNIHFIGHLNPVSLSYHWHFSFKTIAALVANPALMLCDADGLWRYLLLHPVHGWWKNEVGLLWVGFPGGLLILYLLWSAKKEKCSDYLSFFYLGVSQVLLGLIWTCSWMADYSARHLAASSFCILPFVIQEGCRRYTIGKFWGKTLWLTAGLFYLGLPLLYGVSSVIAKIERMPAHYVTGPSGLYLPSLAVHNVPEVRQELLQDYDPKADVWYLPEPTTALDLPGRSIVTDADFMDKDLLAKSRYVTSSPLRIRLLSTEDLEKQGKGAVVRNSFPQADRWTQRAIPGSPYRLWMARLQPLRQTSPYLIFKQIPNKNVQRGLTMIDYFLDISFILLLGLSFILGLLIYYRLPDWSRLDRLMAGCIPFISAVVISICGREMFSSVFLCWESIRLLPSYMFAHGLPLYFPPDKGPILDMMYGPMTAVAYWPVTWLTQNPAYASVAGKFVTWFFYFLPVIWIFWSQSRGDQKKMVFAIVTFLGFVLYTHESDSLWLAGFGNHSDAPALGFCTLACIFLMLGRERKPFLFWSLSAISICLSVWTKQVTLPLLGALPLYLWVVESLWAAVLYGGIVAFFGILISSFFVHLYGFKELWFNLISNPSNTPWVQVLIKVQGHVITELIDEGRWIAIIFLFFIAQEFSTSDKPRKSFHEWFRQQPWGIFVWASLFMVPSALIGRLKAGGGLNSIGFSIFFTVVASCLLFIQIISRPAHNAVTHMGIRLVKIGVCFGTLASVLYHLPSLSYFCLRMSAHRTEWDQNPLSTGYRYLKAHPDDTYMPWDPLVSFLATHKLYHFDYALIDRNISLLPVTKERFREGGLPAKMSQVAFPPNVQDEYVMQYLPEFSERLTIPELPGWEVYVRPEHRTRQGAHSLGSLKIPKPPTNISAIDEPIPLSN